MKLNATIFALVFGLLSLAHAVDTLDVYVLRVQFKKESPDNSLTTGMGTFDSDTSSFNLDPVGKRGSIPYWKKHLEFANEYFRVASGGELFVKVTVYPKSGSAYELDKQIIEYNRTQKMKGEKTAQYDSACSHDYMRFIYDAVMKAHDSKDSPFKAPLPESSNAKRVFMIAHAGANRLVDGGGMGTKGANTPGDFWDSYVSRDAWVYLQPDSLPEVVISDDSVSNGLVLKGSAIDTLRTIMVVSETASQDGLNWGINGFVVNQIARELGMPNTYDGVKGISRLGYFDVMDFAGYSAGNGFFPVLPAAWERAYMGWSKVKEVRPTAGHPVTVDIAAAGTGLGTEIVKVPLSASEYLLIENRQRSWNKDGTVEVILDEPNDNVYITKKKVPVDSVNIVFEDSTCNKGKCERNKNKGKGLVVGLDSYDAGLPASGIAVWKVNEWYLRESLRYGYANLWGGDDFRDHQFGLSLVEADEILSIGKTFKNALGEDAYDYGSGTDLLPHLRYAKSKKFDTVTTISPTGYANTATTSGGYTGIKIDVEVPKDARREKTSNAFMGDSVMNFAAQVIRVTISVDDGSIEGSKFPRNVGLANAVRGAVFVEDPENDGEKIIVVGAEDGTLQAFSAMGDTLFVADTVVKQKTLSRDGAEQNVSLYRLGPSYGPLVGIASDGKDVFSLHENALVRTKFSSGIPQMDTVKVSGKAMAGPVVYNGLVWFATDSKLVYARESKDGVFGRGGSFDLYSGFKPQDMAVCKSKDESEDNLVVVGEDGRWLSTNIKEQTGKSPKSIAVVGKSLHEGERFKVACTDLDRDGKLEPVFVGSRGHVRANLLDGMDEIWTREYKRGSRGTSGLKDETSGFALGDINGDGYPEIVFLGDNLVYALDRFGIPVDGFPVTISRGSPVAGFHSDPILVDVTGDKIPEILVPSSDGLVYAYTGKGKRLSDGFPMAAGSYEMTDSLQQAVPMSIYVTDGVKKSKGPELYAFHRNSVTAFRLSKAANGAESAAAAWALPAAGNERTGFFDASKLSDVNAAKAKDEITDFFIYPNPVRGGEAKVRMELGAKPKSIKLDIYDITGLCVYKKDIADGVAGKNQENLDLRNLGSDVYTARLKVKFESGKTKQKLYRIGVVR